MRPKHPLLSLFILITLPIFWSGSHALSIGREYPTSVGLVGFSASTHANGVLLTWETATELNTAAFIFHRRTGDGPFAYLENIGFVDAEGGPALGHIYQVIDETAVLGQTYTYQLIEVEYNNQEFILDEVTITVGDTPTATPTSVPTFPATPAPGQTPIATATIISTATINPTATVQGNNAPPAIATPTVVAALPVGTRFIAPTSVPPTTAVSNPGAQPATPQSPTAAAQTLAESDDDDNKDTPVAGPTTAVANPTPQSVTFNNQIAPGVALAQEGYDSPESQGFTPPINTPIPIGSDRPNRAQAIPMNETNPATTTPEAAQGRLFLWSGFLVALLLFAGSVGGSIILFTRKQTRS